MDDLGVCCGSPNGVVMKDHLLTPTSGPPPNPDPSSISEDCWAIAEEKTIEVINCIHPTLDSEERRKDVIDYVQRLIRNSLGCEVFPYGSVPLKTYLPDGDIDLAALCSLNIEESLAHDVLAILRREEQNTSEYEVKDSQFIDAEVKLVKCLVQNIVVDISFNQLGGLCTLCFLEQVDRLVGKNHLFKRSIILIKAWCYYESRILGAHHGLISTYALETLVLYIFHLFHSSLSGPLTVLYRFLDYFSKFDWENYCISLNGPVLKSSLPDVVVEIAENGRHDLMLSEEFLRNCMDMFSVPSRGLETNIRAFPQKHLNIIDPLKENNNLGRSVHRGNFYRICSAFKYGARKLGRILLLSKEELADEIKTFFINTLDRHGRKYGVGIQNSLLTFGVEGTGTFSLSSHDETISEDEMHLKSLSADFDEDILGVEHRCTSVFRNGLDTYSRVDYSHIVSESGCLTDGTAVSGYRLAGDANDLASPRSLSFRGANNTSDCSWSSNFTTTISGQYYHAPHFYLSGSSTTENGYFENRNLCQRRPPDCVYEKMGGHSWLEHGENHLRVGNTFSSRVSNQESLSCSGSAISSLDANSLESLCLDCRSLDFRERGLAEIADDVENLNPLSDLSGDYDSHLRSLLYGQSCHGFTISAPTMSNPPTLFSQFGNKKPWETVRRSMPLKRNLCSRMNTNGGVFLGSTVHLDNNCTPFNTAFSLKEKHKAGGTGTYLPKTNRSSCRERLSQGRGRNWAPGNQVELHRQARNNGVTTDLHGTYSSGEGTCEQLKQARSPVQSHWKSGLSCQSHQSNGSSTHSNGFSNSSWRLVFGSFGQPQEGSTGLGLDTSHAWGSTQSSKPVWGEKQERVAEQSYHLKNEDFPPLDGLKN